MNHTKLELVILSLVIKIFYNFNINSFNFNVEVGGQTIISKSVTWRTLVAFFEIVIPDKKKYLELVFSRIMQLTSMNFDTHHLKTLLGLTIHQKAT